jgi:hypothetical protein
MASQPRPETADDTAQPPTGLFPFIGDCNTVPHRVDAGLVNITDGMAFQPASPQVRAIDPLPSSGLDEVTSRYRGIRGAQVHDVRSAVEVMQ